MAQLRHDYQQFKDLNTEIMVMVPNGPKMIAKHVQAYNPPYPILMDKGGSVAAQYFQVKKMLLLGTPTVFLVDQEGIIRYAHYAASVVEEPDNGKPLAVLAEMKG